MDWKKLLGSITESVDEELRLRNAYLTVENRILRQQLPGRMQLCDSDRKALAEIGKQLGRKALAEVATIAQPDTILAWYRTLVVQQCESVQPRKSAGRPPIAQEIEDVVVRMARENRSWGYDRIVGAAKNLGYAMSDQTVGNILKRHGIPPAPERTKTLPWREFIRIHLAVLIATDFFTTEVWSRLRLVLSSFLMFFLCLNCHAICITAIAALHNTCGMLSRLRWCRPWHAAAERWGVLLRERGWSRLPLDGTGLCRPSLSPCATHDHLDRPPQGLGTMVLLPLTYCRQIRDGPLLSHHRCSGLLGYPYREAA
jgi:putative transposase